MVKVCSCCKIEKDVSCFRFRDRTKTGKGKYYESICNECVCKNKQSPKSKIDRYIRMDKVKGFNTTIDEQWYINNIQNKLCTYCLLPSDSMVADRIDNTKGHTKDNCIPACPLCNITRMDNYSVEEMKLLGNVIREIKLSR